MENGGVLVAKGNPVLSQSTLRNGVGALGGNLQIASGASASFEGGFVHGGVARLDGGAVYAAEGASFSATNAVFFGNGAVQGTGLIGGSGDVSLDYVTAENGGASCIDAAALRIENSVVWGGGACGVSAASVSVERSDVKGLPAGSGNIAVDPMFANAADPVGEDGILGSLDDGLIPQSGSPLIDGVSPWSEDSLPAYDILDNDRALDGNGDGEELPDIGAYEYVMPMTADIVGGHYVDGEFVAWPQMPVFSNVDYPYQVVDYLKGEWRMVLRVVPPKRKDLGKVSSAYAYVSVLDSKGKKMGTTQKITFYKVQMEGKTYFVSQKSDGTGTPVMLMDNLDLDGGYRDYEMRNGRGVWKEGTSVGVAFYAQEGSQIHLKVPHDQF